ncbi:MAG: FmdE family protein [Bacillota bacterium]
MAEANINSKLWDKAVEFHGHECPGLAYGVRASRVAMDKLGITRAQDEEIVVIAETDSCSVDAIQVITGCTLGKGNLVLKDLGKSAFTFITRKDGKALRLVMRSSRTKPDDGLREKVLSGTATGEEKARFEEMKQQRIQHILEGPEEEVCKIEWVEAKMPQKARIFKSVRCEKCGEYFMEPRGRLEEGKIVCLSCFNEYTRSW